MKADATGPTVSGDAFDEGTAVSSYMEVTVADEDEHDNHDNHNDNNFNMVLPKSMRGKSTSSSPPRNRSRCDTDESGFTLVLRPGLDRDVSGLTECLVPPSPVVRKTSTPRNNKNYNNTPSRVQRKDSGFDLVVSNHAKPMSTLTMMDFEGASAMGGTSPQPHHLSADVQKKWLSTTPRNVDTPIQEGVNEDGPPADRTKKTSQFKRKESGYDLVVSDQSVPMSTLTMLEFSPMGGSSPKPHHLSADVQKKWLSSIDTSILEGANEDGPHEAPEVSLNKLRETRDAKKQARKSVKSDPKHDKKKTSTKSKIETRKSSSGKGKVVKPSSAKTQGSAHSSSDSTKSSSTKRNSGSKGGLIAKMTLATSSQGSAHSADSSSKPSSKSKKKKSHSITKRTTARKEERDQPISPKTSSKTKEVNRDDPITPDTKKVVKRKSKKGESRQDDGLSPAKTKRSSEKRVSVSPKKRNSSSSPKTSKPASGSRRSTKAQAVPGKPGTRRNSGKKSFSTSGGGVRNDPPGSLVHAPSMMINKRQVPAIPIKPSIIVTPQTSDSSSMSVQQNDSKWWSLAGKSRFSTVESPRPNKASLVMDVGAPKSPSMFGKLRRNSLKGRAR